MMGHKRAELPTCKISSVDIAIEGRARVLPGEVEGTNGGLRDVDKLEKK
jgi:hypothetical protein